jgi:hypothetical protein
MNVDATRRWGSVVQCLASEFHARLVYAPRGERADSR